MEDDDLFFEDDVAEEKPAAKPSRPAATKTAARPAAKRPGAAKSRADEPEEVAPNTINLTIAVLLMVITFLVGFVGGTLLERGRAGSTQASASSGSVQAPPLTQEQIQRGALPPGHVPIDQGAGGGAGAGTGGGSSGGTTGGGSKTTTKKK